MKELKTRLIHPYGQAYVLDNNRNLKHYDVNTYAYDFRQTAENLNCFFGLCKLAAVIGAECNLKVR